MNTGYKLIGKCLEKDYCDSLFQKINDAYLEYQKDTKTIAGGVSGHLNCVLGEESLLIKKYLSETTCLQEIANFFKINLEDYYLSIGCNVNLPGSKLQHIHIDGDFNEESFILNIPLIDTTKLNGAIKIIPDSHLEQRTYLQYLLSGISRFTQQIESKQGHGLIRSSNVWHRGTPNQSSQLRPMLSIVLYRLDSPYSKDAMEDDSKHMKGKIRFRDNWYLASSFSRRLQEYIYVYFPALHSFTRIIKSLLGSRDIL